VFCKQEPPYDNTIKRNNTSVVKVKPLLPGKIYNCQGTITYKDQNVTVKINEIQNETKKLYFSIHPREFQIDIKLENLRNWNLKFHYKNMSVKKGQFELLETTSSELIVENLEMSTKYKICLALEHDLGCPLQEDKCQKCEDFETNEAAPFPPSNVKVTEIPNKELKVTWNKPQRKSGKILAYNIVLKGQCIAFDSNACPTDADCQIRTSKNISVAQNIDHQIFDIKPFWSYQVSVFANNSQGFGTNVTIKFNTTSKMQYPSFNIEPDSKTLTVTFNPRCPYTGPVTFYVTAIGTKHSYKNTTIVQYNIEKSLTLQTPIVFGNLTPAKEYRVCILDLNLVEIQCNSTITHQTKPDGHPNLIMSEQRQKRLKLKVERPDNAYSFDDEQLHYYFKMESQCQYSDERCTDSNCTENEVSDKRSSKRPIFDYEVSNLNPYWMYRFKTMLENKAGKGLWSGWTMWFNTTRITDNTLLLTPSFSTTSSDKSLVIHMSPICPYIGKLCMRF
jgi:hypothetical protein